MSNYTYPFTPASADTPNIALSASTQRVALIGGSGQDKTVMVTSAPGGAICFVQFGDSTVEATVTKTPILPGAIYTFSFGQAVTHAAAIGTTGTVYFTTGHGA